MRAWEGNFLRRNGEDLLSMIDTWYQSDISDNTLYNGDLARALGAITARAIIMPSTTDLYFTLADSEAETRLMPNAELRPISLDLGPSRRQSAAMSRGRSHLAHSSASSSGELKRPANWSLLGWPCLCDAPRFVFSIRFSPSMPAHRPPEHSFRSALLTKIGLEVGLATTAPAAFLDGQSATRWGDYFTPPAVSHLAAR